MKERPILFSAPMVRALLNGSKTQTRRVVKIPRGCSWYAELGGESAGWWEDVANPNGWWHVSEMQCPYGHPGDRLWVREAWAPCGPSPCDGALYRAEFDSGPLSIKFKPSIFMPRWASRITLEIVSVRVERLQDISEADCWAEGIHEVRSAGDDHGDLRGSVRQDYQALWESINGDGSWDENPWVWAVEFKRIGSELA